MRKKIILILITILMILNPACIFAQEYDPARDGERTREPYYNPVRTAVDELKEEYNIGDDVMVWVSLGPNHSLWHIEFINAYQTRGYFTRVSSTSLALWLTFYNANNERVFPFDNGRMRFTYNPETKEILRYNDTSSYNQSRYIFNVSTTSDVNLYNASNVVKWLNFNRVQNSSNFYIYRSDYISVLPDAMELLGDDWFTNFPRHWFGAGQNIVAPDEPNWNDPIDQYMYVLNPYDNSTPTPSTFWEKIQNAFDDVDSITDIPTLLKRLFSILVESIVQMGESIINLPQNIGNAIYHLFIPEEGFMNVINTSMNIVTDTLNREVDNLTAWIVPRNVGYPPDVNSFTMNGTTLVPTTDTLIVWSQIVAFIEPAYPYISIFVIAVGSVVWLNVIFYAIDSREQITHEFFRKDGE